MKSSPLSTNERSLPQISQKPHRPRRRDLAVILGLLIAGTGLSLTYSLSRPRIAHLCPVSSTETFPLTGEVKGKESEIAAIVSGQVEKIEVYPGNQVDQGQIVLQLSSEELQSQLKDIQTQLAAAEDYQQQVEAEREAIRERLWAAYLKLHPEESELDQQVRNADQDIIAVERQLATARTELQRAKGEVTTPDPADRLPRRFSQGTPSQQQRIHQLEAQVRGLEHELRLARGAWVRAVSTGLSPYIHSPELDALRQQWVQVLDKLSNAKETIFQLRMQQQVLESRLDRLTVASPIDGIITKRLVEPGDAVGVGEPLLSIAAIETLYLEAHLPPEALDIAQSNQQARVFLNTAPSQSFDVQILSLDRPADTPDQSNNISNNGSDAASSIVIHLGINDPDWTIAPGTAVEGEIVFLDTSVENSIEN
ncbi:HlyD family secretion protein [Thermocoleostomius sinensis]|uniref:Efflux RND transporter periplasmic adaptor subunit n=1 Tax=Thermocoleostomius sinensis A174 TaxID=2016057 RepID=A0A9E8ZI25_9CYAN|nr:efflux RND transporter periplasmic adaptor subunit [Thermocoleostomius sinensis]WAL62112.1 efflux RND transporter periplasmic adaptor subunit [Thermocoleostomius sinensis A174]